jgi:hypothetical protein
MADRMRADGTEFSGIVGLDLAMYDYARSVGNTDIMAAYADKMYDSSGEYWKLKTVQDAEGNVMSYTVDWDDSLDLTIENMDGTTTKIETGQIQTEEKLGVISKWFSENGLVFDDNVNQGFISLGNVSEITQSLINAINSSNSAKNFGTITASFSGSVGELINSGLQIGGLGDQPDQSIMYSLMPDSVYRTTLYGARLITPELEGKATGNLYEWAKHFHDAEDIAGGKIVQTPTATKEISMEWDDAKGFEVGITFDNGYRFESNHLASASAMNLLEAMLLSKNTERIVAGLQFATVGSTGYASTGPHNHLVGKNKYDTIIAPSDIFAAMGIPVNYKNINTELTGFSSKVPYNDPKLLQDISNYKGAFDRQAYVNAHAELFKPRIRNTPNGLVTDIFDISTMTYQRHWQ